MLPEIIPIYRGTYFKEIYALCRRNNFANFDALRFVLSPTWSNNHTAEDSIIGHAMLDKGNMVGFIGCISAIRIIRGQSYTITHNTTGIVENPYRRFTLDLIAKNQEELASSVQLNISPVPVIYSLCTSLFSFTPLYTHEYLFNRLLLWRSSKPMQIKTKFPEIIEYIETSDELFPLADLVLDNAKYFAQCAICCFDDGELLVMFIDRKIEFIKVIQIIFVSDRSLFSRHLHQTVKKLTKITGVLFCFCPALFIEESASAISNCPIISSDWLSRFRCMASPIVKVPYRPIVRFPDGCNLQSYELDFLYGESVLYRHHARLRHITTLLGDGYAK